MNHEVHEEKNRVKSSSVSNLNFIEFTNIKFISDLFVELPVLTSIVNFVFLWLK